MSWHNFLIVYVVVTLALWIIFRGWFRNRQGKVFRTLVFVTSLSCLCDYLAEDRAFWFFEDLWGIAIFGVPVENILFMATTTLLALLCYRGVQRISADH